MAKDLDLTQAAVKNLGTHSTCLVVRSDWATKQLRSLRAVN